MTGPIDCPTSQQWLAFSAGQLSHHVLDLYARHLERCQHCTKVLEEVLPCEDGILRALKVPQSPEPQLPDAALERLVSAARTFAPPSKLDATGLPRPTLPCLDDLSQLGPFEIGEIAGSGSFGVVYRAVDTRLGREVALKLPRSDLVMTPQLKRRFLWEAQASAKLDHPNLVAVYEAGEIEGVLYIATGYCTGPTLGEHLERSGPLPVRIAAQLIAALASAVQHAHSRGVIHRDIKPSNILLERTDERGAALSGAFEDGGECFVVKIADFGLAKPIENELLSSAASTRSWALMGTPDFMAPEVVAQGSKAADQRGDIYALGIVLYQLLVGRTPFQGQSFLQTLQQIERDEPVPPRRLRCEIPRDLQTICLKCLTKSPSERYATAEYLAADLQNFLDGRPVVARPLGPAARLTRWSRRRPALAMLVALCLTGAMAAIAGLSEHNRRLGLALARADDSERTARAHLYAANIRLASQAHHVGDFVRCGKYLDLCRPGAAADTNADLRGFEWRLLRQELPFKPSEATLEAHQGGVTCVAYSADGAMFATSGLDSRIRIWRFADRNLIFQADAHVGDVNKVAFSPNGEWLVSGGDDGRVRVWNIAAKAMSLEIKHPGRVFEVAFSQDGRYVISAGDGKFIQIWNAQTGVPVERLLGDGVTALAVSQTSALLATGHRDRKLRIWDMADMTLAATGDRKHQRDIDDVTFDQDGGRLATASRDGTARIWNAGTGELIQEFKGHLDGVHAVSFSHDDKLLATASRDNTIRLWDDQGHQMGLLRGHDDMVWSLAFAPHDDTLATASRDGTVRFWNVPTIVTKNQRKEVPRDHLADSRLAALAPDGKTLVMTAETGAKILDVESLEQRTRLASPKGASVITILTYSGDGRMIAGADQDGSVSIWDANTAQALHHFRGHQGRVWGIEFAPHGRTLATCGEDFKARLWDAQTAELRREFDHHSDMVRSLAFSPDGRLLATGSDDRTIVIWNLRENRIQATCLGAKNVVSSLSFSLDSNALASGTHSGRVIRWNAQTGREIDTLIGHTDRITAISFSPDGRTLVSGSADKTLRFWQTETGQEMMTIREQIAGTIVGLSFSTNSRLLLTCERGPQVKGSAFLWRGASLDEG